MKILQVISGREINGAIMHVDLLTGALNQLGHEVTVACRPNSWLLNRLKSKYPNPLIRSEMNRIPMTELNRVAAIVRRQKFDIIHTHQSRAHMFGLLLRMKTGIPVVATAHCRRLQLHWWLNDFVIANSEATRKYHMRVNRVPGDRIETAHCFIDVQRFAAADKLRRRARRELGIHDQRPLLGVVGEVIPRKGQIYLFRALPKILERFPDARLMVIGRFNKKESYVRQLREILYHNRLFNRVIWVGRRNNTQDFYGAMDICITPSVEEPLGLVPMEAMASGTPSIVSDSGGLTEVVNHGHNGLVVPRKDPQAIVDAVCQVLTDGELRTRLIRNGRATSKTAFDPLKLSQDVVNIFDRVKASKRRAAA